MLPVINSLFWIVTSGRIIMIMHLNKQYAFLIPKRIWGSWENLFPNWKLKQTEILLKFFFGWGEGENLATFNKHERASQLPYSPNSEIYYLTLSLHLWTVNDSIKHLPSSCHGDIWGINEIIYGKVLCSHGGKALLSPKILKTNTGTIMKSLFNRKMKFFSRKKYNLKQ